jgi:hypothetical protein
VRKISCTFELLWQSGFRGEHFSMTPPHFCDHFPFEEDVALYVKNFLFSSPNDDLIKFESNWPASSDEESLIPSINTCKYGFSNRGPSRPQDPWFERTWICIMSERFHVNLSSFCSVGLERKIFKWPPFYFCSFVIISPLKRTWLSICTILNFLYPTMIWTKFDWNWPVGSEKKIFKNVQCIFLQFFAIIFPWPAVLAFIWTILNSLPARMHDLCQVWLKLAQWFWRSKKCKSLQTDEQRTIRKTCLSF